MIVERIGLGPMVQAGWAFVISLAASAILAWPVFQLLLKVGSKQRVSEYVPEHAKKQGTPTMGGLIAIVGTMVGIVSASDMEVRLKAALCGGITAFALIGFFDDFVLPKRHSSSRGFGWIPKLILQILAAAIPVVFGGDNTPSLATMAWQIFLVLFFVNAFNFADGLDGLSGGLLIFIALGACVMGFVLLSVATPLVTAALIGAIVPFLWLNAPPAKVFMGDVGSMPIGFLLGIVCIDLIERANAVSGVNSAIYIALALWAGVLIAELVPVPIQIASVKIFKRRVFAKTPIHHAFESRGVPETRVVWGFLLIQLVLSALAASFLIGIVAGEKP